MEALETGGDGTAVHDEICGREAHDGNGVGCFGGCVGGHAVGCSTWREMGGGGRDVLGLKFWFYVRVLDPDGLVVEPLEVEC